ncbi:ferrochelatase, partial [Acinetobacter baumannii]
LEGAFGPDVTVDWAMRYGKPSIRERLEAMRAAGVDRLLVAPLYPQYCAATTATVNDLVFDTLKRWRWQPALRTLAPYYDAPEHIAALATSV